MYQGNNRVLSPLLSPVLWDFSILLRGSLMCSFVQTQYRLLNLALFTDPYTISSLGLLWVKIQWIFLYNYVCELFVLFWFVLFSSVLGTKMGGSGKVDVCSAFQTLLYQTFFGYSCAIFHYYDGIREPWLYPNLANIWHHRPLDGIFISFWSVCSGIFS